ncbi:S8 family serine peptidase [Flavobacterium suzhouense]|uniref:S8 family serine peptidase n=1 Tax=Flavobacterium suzhouense TaxID=1529638 RepID=A0ABW5NXL2_9FLAO
MKKNTVKLFVLALALGGGLIATAQNRKLESEDFKPNQAALKGLSEKYRARYEKELAEALRLAEVNNWPVEEHTKEGGYRKLTAVDASGNPVYTETYNAGSAITSRVNELHPGGSSNLGLTGKFEDGTYMQLGIWDGEYPLLNHQEFLSPDGQRFESGDGPPSASAAHPTHVLGTMIATGVNPQAQGMAYEATGKVFNFNLDFAEMAANAATLILSNHSYGIPELQRGVYTDYAKEVDEIMFFSRRYQPVIAAGNEGNGVSYNRMGDRGIAKNAVTVAAIYELDHVTTTVPAISDFSSFGPTSDNRIKPDISAKGVAVFSSLNSSSSAYGNLQGTSMACPGVTGAFALIQQYYAEKHTPEGMGPGIENKAFMLSSSLRALMAHTALEAGDNPGPDAKFGWGVLDARKMADVITNEGVSSAIIQLTLRPGEEHTYEVQALGGEPLIATLAWTDPAPVMPSSGIDSTPQVNDLDIKIEKGTSEFFPWKLGATPSSPAIKGDNSKDNIEKVEVENASGTYTIRISHKGNTLVNPAPPPSFDDPNPVTEPLQIYSLVITGFDATLANEEFVQETFSVWPNPAQGHLNISMASDVEVGAKATIYDIQGRVVLKSAISSANTELNIENLSSGIYMVNVENGKTNTTKKFIVK